MRQSVLWEDLDRSLGRYFQEPVFIKPNSCISLCLEKALKSFMVMTVPCD